MEIYLYIFRVIDLTYQGSLVRFTGWVVVWWQVGIDATPDCSNHDQAEK